jgi:hypothetical protein
MPEVSRCLKAPKDTNCLSTSFFLIVVNYTLTTLYNTHRYLVPKHFCHPHIKLYPLAATPPLAPGSHQSVWVCIVNTAYVRGI